MADTGTVILSGSRSADGTLVERQVTHQSVTLTADHRTMVELLAPSGAPPSHLLDARELPQALSRDHSGRIFDVTGTDQHITSLREMYHP